MINFTTHDKTLGEVIVASYRQKYYIKVTALHVQTGVEACVLCPVTASEEVQGYIALSKLDNILSRRHQSQTRDTH